MTTTTDPISVSVARAADLLGISTREAYYRWARRELPGAYKSGRRILVDFQTLKAWSAEQAEAQVSK